MSKFNTRTATVTRVGAAPIQTVSRAGAVDARTAEGGAGWTRTAESELFLLAVTNMVGEDTFYESATERDVRFADLIGAVTAKDPEWVARFLPWLRNEANMRSAALVGAAAYVRAGGPNGRSVTASVLSRADEPGEMLAYWLNTYGRAIPKPIKRGVSDAAARLFDERSAVKWDSPRASVRMGDVIDLCHCDPRTPWQSDLYRWLLDTRHNRTDIRIPETLPSLRARADLLAVPIETRRALLTDENGAHRLREAGMTWESLSGWLNGPMDAQAWEAVIPSMGYMALLRNLRNFDEAGVSDATAQTICARLADPEQVARSRQLPLRFLSAYRAAPSLRWGWALEQALNHSVAGVPALTGRTLVLVDVSGSMSGTLSARSTVDRASVAALFGVVLHRRSQTADLYAFNTSVRAIAPSAGGSLLPLIEKFRPNGGTETAAAIRMTYDATRHDRVVIITDEQAYPGAFPTLRCPLYTFNVGGYRVAHSASDAMHVSFGGLSDAGFAAITAIESRHDGGWPF